MSSPSPTSNLNLKIRLLNLKKPIVRLFWKEDSEDGPEFADEYFLPEVAIKLIIERMKFEGGLESAKKIEGYFQNVKRQSEKREESLAKYR